MGTSLEGKTVVITGASSGLGKQLSIDLARLGASLLLADKDAAGLASVAEEVGRSGARIFHQATDVTKVADCQNLIGFALQSLERIDFLVLCAGVSMWAPFDQIDDLEIFRRLMEVNYLGAVNCIHPALTHLKSSGGTIVAISSLQGEVAIPHHTGYSASKHALNGFLESLELEIGDSVRILCVMPGWITGTNLRANAFQAGTRKGGDAARGGAASVSVGECSRLIIRAMQRNTRALFVPGKLKALLWLRAVAPSLLKLLIRRAVQDQERH